MSKTSEKEMIRRIKENILSDTFLTRKDIKKIYKVACDVSRNRFFKRRNK